MGTDRWNARERKLSKCQVARGVANLEAFWWALLFTNLLFLAAPLVWSRGSSTRSCLIAASGEFDPFNPDGSSLPGIDVAAPSQRSLVASLLLNSSPQMNSPACTSLANAVLELSHPRRRGKKRGARSTSLPFPRSLLANECIYL